MPGIITGIEENLFQEQRTELVHGGRRPVGGMVNSRSKAFPQLGQSKVSFGKDGEAEARSSGSGAWMSVSRRMRRAARSRRWDEPKKPK